MLDFRPLAMEDYEKYQNLTQGIQYPLCEYCFADVFIWSKHCNVKACFAGDMFFARSEYEGHYSYTVPIGTGDLVWAIEQLRRDAVKKNMPFRMHAVCQESKEQLEQAFPGKFSWELDQDGCDYIYEAEKLITLKGKKLQSKRNLVNRFQKEHEGQWTYRDIATPEDRQAVYQFHLQWCEENQVCTHQYQGETCAVYQALENWDALHLEGGMLFLEDKMIAFTIGSHYRPDMYVMHFEKADGSILGAYQMINQQFAQWHFQAVSYVNREEDMGLEGLRKAKMSYHPLNLGEEYCGIWKEDEVWSESDRQA